MSQTAPIQVTPVAPFEAPGIGVAAAPLPGDPRTSMESLSLRIKQEQAEREARGSRGVSDATAPKAPKV